MGEIGRELETVECPDPVEAPAFDPERQPPAPREPEREPAEKPEREKVPAGT